MLDSSGSSSLFNSSLSSILVCALRIPLPTAAPLEGPVLGPVFLCRSSLWLAVCSLVWLIVCVSMPRLVTCDRRSLGREVTDTKI